VDHSGFALYSVQVADLNDDLIDVLWSGVAGENAAMPKLRVLGLPTLDSAFPVSDLATASVAVAGLAVSQFVTGTTDVEPTVTVDRGLADAWFAAALSPVGWQLPSPWDAIAGDYETADGWIRLHTNAPHHKTAALAVLKTTATRTRVAAAVRKWRGLDLENAIVAANGCAAVMLTDDQWLSHEQGAAVADEDLVARESGRIASVGVRMPDPSRPLTGIRVLDLTRVIAGPVASRFLASFGADVLRIDPPDWDEPGVVPEMTLGKRSARLDIRSDPDRFRRLVAGADIVLHGYRANALDDLGFDDAALGALRPGLVIGRLNAYGWTGPWRNRRGFDSLVQMSSGIADAGMRWADASKPTPLPVQALDHATGYLTAAAVIVDLGRALRSGYGSVASLSLARTARVLATADELAPLRRADAVSPAARANAAFIARNALGLPARENAPFDVAGAATAVPQTSTRLETPWGPADLLAQPLTVGAAAPRFDRPPRPLGTDPARW
jgi:crotonobetainyl-CoA:carnitine CoA-transferase CaiB-like acyl-CoA transferase